VKSSDFVRKRRNTDENPWVFGVRFGDETPTHVIDDPLAQQDVAVFDKRSDTHEGRVFLIRRPVHLLFHRPNIDIPAKSGEIREPHSIELHTFPVDELQTNGAFFKVDVYLLGGRTSEFHIAPPAKTLALSTLLPKSQTRQAREKRFRNVNLHSLSEDGDVVSLESHGGGLFEVVHVKSLARFTWEATRKGEMQEPVDAGPPFAIPILTFRNTVRLLL
jgi:hypothetical protein